jgi:hypothetical protein
MTLPNVADVDNDAAALLASNVSTIEMNSAGPFQYLPKHLLIELAKNCMEIVRAILDLGVPSEVAQLFAKEFPQQFGELIGERVSPKGPTPHWLEDTCILIQHIENPSADDMAHMADQTWGWQENPTQLTTDQLSTALQHGATFKHSAKGFDLFQRMDLSAEQLHALAQCVDVLALKNKTGE